jgi:hypothetical protein
LPFAAPWSAPNACGPVGGTLAFFLVWALGRMAAFGVPVLAASWFWNRLHNRPIGQLVLKSTLAALLVFEVCTLLGLGGLDRAAWSGGWGFAAALALRSALGGVGSWIVAGALFGVTVLAASELGFRWLGPLVRGALFTPFAHLASAWQEWRARVGRRRRRRTRARGAQSRARRARRSRSGSRKWCGRPRRSRWPPRSRRRSGPKPGASRASPPRGDSAWAGRTGTAIS